MKYYLPLIFAVKFSILTLDLKYEESKENHQEDQNVESNDLEDEAEDLQIREDLDEDPFYQQESNLEQYDGFEKIFKSTLEKQGIDPQKAANVNIDDTFLNTVILNVLDKFNSPGIVPEISGFLKKKSGFMKFFQKRYFVCRGNELCYFHNPKDNILRGCINFDV